MPDKYDDRMKDLCICGHTRGQHVLTEDSTYGASCKRCHCTEFIDIRERD